LVLYPRYMGRILGEFAFLHDAARLSRKI
jgi:hypothetical protein